MTYKVYGIFTLFLGELRGVARRLKSRHNMIEGKILGVRTLDESMVECPCRGNGGRGGRMAKYATERHIRTFFKKNPKFMFRHVPSRALGSYAHDIAFNNVPHIIT